MYTTKQFISTLKNWFNSKYNNNCTVHSALPKPLTVEKIDVLKALSALEDTHGFIVSEILWRSLAIGESNSDIADFYQISERSVYYRKKKAIEYCVNFLNGGINK